MAAAAMVVALLSLARRNPHARILWGFLSLNKFHNRSLLERKARNHRTCTTLTLVSAPDQKN
jgi:hypothetical protein